MIVPYDKDHAALVSEEVRDALDHARARTLFPHLTVLARHGGLAVAVGVPIIYGRGTTEEHMVDNLTAAATIAYLDALTRDQVDDALRRLMRDHSHRARERAVNARTVSAAREQACAAAVADWLPGGRFRRGP